MSSQSILLASIEARLANAKTPADLIYAKMCKAIFLARRGDIREAQVLVADMRSAGTSSHQAEYVARANLAEGVLESCLSEYGRAADKLKRARALGIAANPQGFSRACDAWLAYVAFNEGRLVDIPALLRPVIADASRDEHSTLSRAGVTLAVALHHCDRYDLARPWYEFSRRHAVSEGDDLTIDAILHNIAAFRLQSLRLQEIEGQVNATDLHQAEQELASSLNYDAMKAPASFRWTLPLQRLQLLQLSGRSDEAVSLWEEWHAEYSEAAPMRLRQIGLMDFAFCLASGGRTNEAIGVLERVELNLNLLAKDELALVLFRRSQIESLCIDAAAAKTTYTEARSALAEYREEQAENVQQLMRVPFPA